MELVIQALWGGILFGSVYGLMAVGLTLIWGSLNLLNLAHGALYVVGAYATYTIIVMWGLPSWIGFLGGVVFAGLFGAVLYFAVVKTMMGRPGWDYASWIATVAFAIIVENILRLVYGPRLKEIPAVFEGRTIVQGISITHQGILVTATAVVSLVALHVFMRQSRHGLAIRAVSQQQDAAQLMGIPVMRVFLSVMIVSAALAGVAGILLTSILSLTPFAGFQPLLMALIVVILGGIGSIKGTIVGAYAIGLLEASTQVTMGVGWSLPVLFTFIIFVLIVRPEGLFGEREVVRV